MLTETGVLAVRDMAKGEIWVELVGDLVIARVRGEPTERY